MKKLLWFFFHTFTKCPDKYLEFQYRGKLGTCCKCGRKHFIWNKF